MFRKWKVESAGHVLGHYTGHTPQEAVAKARDKVGRFYGLGEGSIYTVRRCGGNGNEVREVVL